MQSAYFINCFILISCICFASSSELIAQPQADRLVLYSIEEDDGLSDNRVNIFFEDSRGFMWIGTQDGLNRFDGSVVTAYKHKTDDSTSIGNDAISDIAEDLNQHLWITTADGLIEYDHEQNIFRTFRIESLNDVANIMSSVCADNHGNIWISSDNGLFQFIVDSNKFVQHFNNSHTEVSTRRSDNRIAKILKDSKGRFWLATANGLWRFHPDNNQFEKIDLKSCFPGEMILNIMEDHNGKLWVSGWLLGLMVYDPESGTVTPISDKLLAGETLKGLIEIKDAHNDYSVWCSGLKALNEHGRAKKFSAFGENQNADYSSSKYCQSRDGLVWISTPQGAKIMDPNGQFFEHLFFDSGFTNQSISLFEKEKQLYVGGQGVNFLTIYDSTFHVIRKFSDKKLRGALLNMVEEDDQQLWFCTEDGLVLFNELTGKVKNFSINESMIDTRTRNFFPNMFIDSKGRHWVFPWRTGIWQLDVELGKFEKMFSGFENRNGELRKSLVCAAVEDENKNIWFADLDEGLIFWDSRQNVFSKPTNHLFANYRLSGLCYDKPYLWLAMNGRVARIQTLTKQIDYWPVPENFDKTIHSFCSDQQNHLWMATSSGLLCFDKSSHLFSRFSTNDGLVKNDMDGTLICLQDGKIVFASSNYLTRFDPRQLLKPSPPASVIITDLFSQNIKIKLEERKTGEKMIELPYTFDNFTFGWALLNYHNPTQNRYYCKLEGVDKDWKYVGNTGQAQYSSLAPGTYVFKARGISSSGVEGKNEDYIVISILPPFWKTWWFISISVALLLFIIYWVYRYRLNAALTRERLRTKISTDLHDDLGSTLSSISILSELVEAKGGTSELITEIRNGAQSLMEKMDDIVWGINPDNDSLGKLILRIRRFASQMFEARNIDYSFEVQDHIDRLNLSMEYRQHLYLILKESINNLIKHAQATSANIRISHAHGLLKIVIADNGKGFLSGSLHEGNGLRSIRKRSNALGAVLAIESKPDHGTEISLQVKIR